MKLENWHPEASAPQLAPLFTSPQTDYLRFVGGDSDQLRAFLAPYDCPLVPLADGLAFALPKATWEPFAALVRRRFTTDGDLLNSLAAREAERTVWWQAGRFRYNLNRQPLVYGILNVTPDSFYDGGRFNQEEAMAAQVKAMVEAGADIIEPGGQTTKPGGFVEVDPAEEWARIAPAIALLKRDYPQVAIAVDTYKLPVMERALAAGVDIINDVNGFETAAKRQLLAAYPTVGLVTMHSSRGHEYQNLTAGMRNFFTRNLAELAAAGIARERICLDQGIGYAKVADGDQDLAMMNNLGQLTDFKRPVMVAISRKGFGKRLFGLAKEDRLGVTLVAETAMMLAGGRVLRVHDVRETRQLVDLVDRIRQAYWTTD